MTWVVGASSFFGYGVMVSDVRVSFSDGTQSDLLRKVYPVGPWMLAGFAGSVRIGMTLVEDLRRFIASKIPRDVTVSADLFLRPDLVAKEWALRAEAIFRIMPGEERDSGAQIMLVGVDDPPPERPLPPNAQQMPYVHIVSLSWPDFEPDSAHERWTARHIGSGSNIEQFVEGIKDLFSIDSGALNAEMMPGGWGALLGYCVGKVVRNNPVDGISAHANIDICQFGGFLRSTNDETIYPRDDAKIVFKMPAIAESYEQFLAMCEQRGKAASGATC